VRRAALAASCLLILWGTFVAATGGLDVRIAGMAIRSRDPFRALIAGLAILLVLAAVFRSATIADLDWLAGHLRRRAPIVAALMALTLGADAVRFGTFSVGGADAYGYVNQAYDWASGQLPRAIPLPLRLPFPGSDEMQAPLGYRLGQQPHTMIPTYAPGLPLIMAAALVAGGCGPFFVVPFFAMVLLWFTFRLGERAAGRLTGLLAAIVLIVSPVVLYQSVWPMSDVPAAALWTGAAVFALRDRRRDALAAGLFAAPALLVRPNLPLLWAVPLMAIAWRSEGRERWTRLAAYAIPAAAPAVIVATLNTLWFGAATKSGYGAPGDLYQWPNVWPNVKLYSAWLWASQSPGVLLALVPLVPPFARRVNRPVVLLCVALVLGTFACYVSYGQFEVWWYLRFLLPAAGAFAVLVGAGLGSLAQSLPRPFGTIGAGIALWLLCASTLRFASGAGVFGGIRESERRYVAIGEFAAHDLPENAVMFAMQHAGSLRFYSGRMTLRYDLMRPEWARDLPAAVERAGYHPYLVIDDWEAPYVRPPFGLPPDSPLPWPVRARMRELGGLTVFDLATRPDGAGPTALEPGTSHWCDARHPLFTPRP
jgi:hypothetical protein